MFRKDHTRVLLLFALLLILAGIYFTGETKTTPSQAKVKRMPPRHSALILYDENKPYDGAALHAVAIANLLGHFKLSSTIKPVSEYAAGELAPHSALFYIGYVRNAYIPPALFKDIFSMKDKTVVWFKYGLNQLQGSAGLDFAKEYGFYYTRSVQQGEGAMKGDSFFDRFHYKGRTLDRGRITGRLKDVKDMTMGIAKTGNFSIAKTWATVENPETGETVPYIIQAKNIWYVADIPVEFLELRDSYLIFCDILHDMLNADHPRNLTAVFRIEDVNPSTSADEMRKLLDFFREERIPATIGVIPFYKDPAGVRYERAVETSLGDSPELLSVLRKARDGGAQFVMHGVTHQRDEPSDPLLRVTAYGYEFWDAEGISPLMGESADEVRKRLDRGKNEFQKYGLEIAAYETPHYMASPLDYRVFAGEFEYTMQSVTYYLYDASRLTPDKDKPKKPVTDMLTQSFPYTIYGDIYGQYIIPSSTIDSFEYDDAKTTKAMREKMDLMIRQADALTVVRDGCASFYIHPFVITAIKQHNMRWAGILREITGSLRKMGYRFTSVRALKGAR